MRSPRFALCPAPHRTLCSIGFLPANQAFELIVKAHVGTKATVGEQITLTMTVQGTALSPAEAAVTSLVTQNSSAPGSGSTPPILTFPPVPYPYPGSTVTPGN